MATRNKKAPETAMVKWQEELAKVAAKQAGAEKPVDGIKSIRIQGSTLMVDDEPVEGNELEVVVLTGVHVNTYYDRPYSPDDKSPPTCYAYGDPEADDPEAGMAPHEAAAEPQHDNCAECPFNQWGSNGRGKACQNRRRLALIPSSALEEGVEGADMRVFSLSPTNIKHWSKYLRRITTDLDDPRPSWGVITRIAAHPDPKTQYRLTFERVGEVDFSEVDFNAMKQRVAEANEALTQPWPEPTEEAPPPRKKAPARKAPTRSKKF